jgi:hypothetical protein
MRNWVYTLTVIVVILVLVTITGFIAVGSELTALRRQLRTGNSFESSLSLPNPTYPALALPTDMPVRDTTVTIIEKSYKGNIVSLMVRVQTEQPVYLFSTTPILADAAGKGYTVSQESLDKASVSALHLAQQGYADLTLDFQVGTGFIPSLLIFNNGSDNMIYPVLKVALER